MTLTQSTPYPLVYEAKAILPLKIQIPSLCIAMQEGFHGDESHMLRLVDLEP